MKGVPIAIPPAPITFKRLLPPGDPAEVQEIVTGLGLHERTGASMPAPDAAGRAPAEAAGRRRPYVVLNMIATLDGRATLNGRSGPISDSADRALFHGLRSVVDAIMAGAGTVRTERYGPIVRDPDLRRLRVERGLSERPLACVVTASLTALTPERVPLLADPDSQVAIVTPSQESLPETPAAGGGAARVEYVRARREDDDGSHARLSLDLPAALAELHDRLHVRTLLCEGGPHLNTQLLSAGLVDELFLSVSPLLAGGGGEGDRGGSGLRNGGLPPLRILAGTDLRSPIELELCSALEHHSRLFLRYRVMDGG